MFTRTSDAFAFARRDIRREFLHDVQDFVFSRAKRPTLMRKLLRETADALLDLDEAGIKSRLAHIVKDCLNLRTHFTSPENVGKVLDYECPEFGYIVVTSVDDRWIEGACSIILYA